MKACITTISLLFSLCLSAQKIEQYFDFNWKQTEEIGKARYYALIEKQADGWSRKDYYLREGVLQMSGTYQDQATKIAQGRFHFFHANKVLQSVGSFMNGKKEGLWLSYFDNGELQDSSMYLNGNKIGLAMGWHRNGYPSDSSFYHPDGSGISVQWFDDGGPSAAGSFTAGRKQHGKWQYFHKNGNPSAHEIYQNGVLVSRQYFSEDGSALTDTASRDRYATFPGGPKAWLNYLQKGIYFPSQYKITGSDEVVVTVDWIIDEEGNVQHAFVSSPFHKEFDLIALQVIRKSPKWLPAISHNRRVRFSMRQPVTFSQQ